MSKNGIKEGGGGDEVAKWVGVQLLTASHADSEGDLNANPHEDPDSYIQTTSTSTTSTSTTSHQISLQSFLYATIYSIFFFLNNCRFLQGSVGFGLFVLRDHYFLPYTSFIVY